MFSNSISIENETGLYINGDNMPNHAHGSFSNCSFNHNNINAIKLENISYGFIFNGCHFFFGNLAITNCKGIIINSSLFGSCNLLCKGNIKENIISNSFFQTNKDIILKNNNDHFIIKDCI